MTQRYICLLALYLCLAQSLTRTQIAFVLQPRHSDDARTSHPSRALLQINAFHRPARYSRSRSIEELRAARDDLGSSIDAELREIHNTAPDIAAPKAKRKSGSKRVGEKVQASKGVLSKLDNSSDGLSNRTRVDLKHLATPQSASSTLKGSEVSYKDRLARAAENILAERAAEEMAQLASKSKRLSLASISTAKARGKRQSSTLWSFSDNKGDNNKPTNTQSTDLLTLMDKINQKILKNNWSRATKPIQVNENNLYDGPNVHAQHATDSIQSLLAYNHFEGEWSDRNATTYHVAICFGKPLINDMITVEYATRIRTLVKLLKEDGQQQHQHQQHQQQQQQQQQPFTPKLICFTGGAITEGNTLSDASAGYIYFRHLLASQNMTLHPTTQIWLDTKSSNERESMERIASELWRHHIKLWLSERPLVERMNQHYGVGWKILERKVDIHFTLVSTEYHLCNLNDVHHRSPLKSFLQPLVSLRGLAGSDRWENYEELEVMDPNYSTSVHVKKGSGKDVTSSSSSVVNSAEQQRNMFGGIENSVDTSWSFQYGTYPFLNGEDEAIVFLGQCYLLGEELTPLLVNMKGVVEQTEFFQRDNYYLLSSIRRSLVSLVESLYTEKGQSIRLGVINHFARQGRNRFTKEDVKIIVVLESALLNLGRCIDLVKPAGLLVSSVPATTWSRALDALQKSMNHIQTVCDPDQPLEPAEWGKLSDYEEQVIDLSPSRILSRGDGDE